MNTFNIQVFTDEIMQEIESKAKLGVNKSLDYLEKKIDERTPVDTGEYEKGNKRNSAIKIGGSIYGELYNDSINREEVEYGFRSTPVNWHKKKKQGGPVIYRGVGARTYTRTADLESDLVKQIIQKEIG